MNVPHALSKFQYFRLHRDSYAQLCELMFSWELLGNGVIFSVLSDSECENDKGKILEEIETKPNDSVQSIRKVICSSLVDAAATTSAYVIFHLPVNLSTCM